MMRNAPSCVISLCPLFTLAALMQLCGCAMQTASTSPGPATAHIQLHGQVYGGQQPVSGQVIQLYAAGNSGYGSASTPLISTTVTTTTTGTFNITGDYTCPSAASQTYLVGVGGDTGNGNNPNIVLMAALGNCGDLGPSTFVNMNEVTTVATVWALAPFMTGYANVGSTASNTAGLANAFASVNKLVSIARGLAPGALPSGASVSSTEIYTLADILAACVNTNGGSASNTSTVCGQLFAATTPSGGAAPTTTADAALSMAKHPALNASTLYGLVPATAPFQPTLTSAPTDWTISITYAGGSFKSPSASAVDASGQVWVANAGSGSVSVLSQTGAPIAGSPFSTGVASTPSAIAIDTAGNAWIANAGTSTVAALTPTGSGLTGAPFGGGGLSAPSGVAIDPSGNIWVTNSGNNSVSEFSSTGTALSPSSGFTGAGITAPVAVAINPH